MSNDTTDVAVERYLNGDRIVDIESDLGIARQTLYNALRDRGVVPSRPRGKKRRVIRIDEELDATSIEGLLQRVIVLQRRVEALEKALSTIEQVAGTVRVSENA